MSTRVRAYQILYARIVEVGGVAVLDGAAPWPLPAELKAAILALRQEMLEQPFSGAVPAHARQRLLAHELELRSFYWGFIEQAFKEASLRPEVFTRYRPARRAPRCGWHARARR